MSRKTLIKRKIKKFETKKFRKIMNKSLDTFQNYGTLRKYRDRGELLLSRHDFNTKEL